MLLPGYYLIDNHITQRCYYITGTKKGNKWIETEVMHWCEELNRHERLPLPNCGWWALNWMCIPKVGSDELVGAVYYEENPLPDYPR